MQDQQRIIILDFGGQYTQLIARRVRECRVYSEVMPWRVSAKAIRAREPVGIILSGGPASVNDPDAPRCDPAVYDLGVRDMTGRVDGLLAYLGGDQNG